MPYDPKVYQEAERLLQDPDAFCVHILEGAVQDGFLSKPTFQILRRRSHTLAAALEALVNPQPQEQR